MDFSDCLKQHTRETEQIITAYLPAEEGPQKTVLSAMNYSFQAGGKRLRPYLLCECAALFDVSHEKSFPAAASLEMLHSYSLVHDDLPAMDNDDLRRGKPTCHKKYDEATAILAGDGLQAYAFEFLAKAQIIEPEIRLTLLQLLSNAAGAFDGMVAGQTLDLYAFPSGNFKEDENVIARLEEMKTGRLLRYACEAGAVLGKAPLDMRWHLVTYARKIGQAFQIADDILDREGDQNLLGKTLHKDESQHKLTYVAYYGVNAARQLAYHLIKEAQAELVFFGKKAENLHLLAQYIVDRKK